MRTPSELREYAREYRERRRDHINAQARKNYKKRMEKVDREKLRQRWRDAKNAEYLKNREKIRKRNKANYQRDRERRKLAAREYERAMVAKDPCYHQKHHLRQRDKRIAGMRRYYARHKQAFQKRGELYRKEHAAELVARAVEREMLKRKLTRGDLKAIRSFYAHVYTAKGVKCHYCEQLLKFGKFARHVDHRTPLSRGGFHELANLVPACQRCNLCKNALTETEFRKQRLPAILAEMALQARSTSVSHCN